MLTESLINEYEKGLSYTEVIKTDARFGAVHHTLTVTNEDISEPPSKKPNTTGDKFNNGWGLYSIIDSIRYRAPSIGNPYNLIWLV